MSTKNLDIGVKRVAYKVEKFGDHRERRTFSRSRNTMELQDLLEIQKKSYQEFLEKGTRFMNSAQLISHEGSQKSKSKIQK